MQRKPQSDYRLNDGFDVIVQQVIGRVDFGEGDEHPHVVAFQLIGRHSQDVPGTYSFPMESGAVCHVTVTHEETPVA